MKVSHRLNVAVLHVYYRDRTGFRYKSDIRFGIEDFICEYFWQTDYFWATNICVPTVIAAMGGLLSLGFGVSFISFIELWHFICVRFLWHKSNDPKKNDNLQEIRLRRRFSTPVIQSYGTVEENTTSVTPAMNVSVVSLSSCGKECDLHSAYDNTNTSSDVCSRIFR